jgi:hypothetical protein
MLAQLTRKRVFLEGMKTEPQNGVASTPLEKNPAVHEFIRRVSAIEGVRCVVAEPEEDAIHLTTFATPLTEDIEDAIIAVEAWTIDSFPDFLFDFHVFDAARNIGEAPESVPGECFVWGSLDADARRAPEAGKR